MEISGIKDVKNNVIGYKLNDIKYYLKPTEKEQTINLDKKSQIFLTVNGKDTEVEVGEIFVKVKSMEGNIIRGWSILQIIDEKGNMEVDKVIANVALYDKITGVHCTIVEIDVPIIQSSDMDTTTEDLTKYWNIITKGKVTSQNTIDENGLTVEDKARIAEEEKAAAEAKAAEESAAAEAKAAEEAAVIAAAEAAKIAAEEAKAAEEKAKVEAAEAQAKAKEEAEAKAKEEAQAKADAEAKALVDKEAKDKEYAEMKAKATEEAKAEVIKNQLGGQHYIEMQAELTPQKYKEFDARGGYRFFYKGEDDEIFFIKLIKGDVIDLADSIEEAEEDEQTGEIYYGFEEDGERKDLIYNPREKSISVKKAKVETE